jgi:hypothetical protein
MSALSSADREKVRERLTPVIAAVTERIHYAEQRRSNFSAIGGAFVAAGIAVLTFAFTSIETLAVKFGFVGAGLSLSVVGALVLIAYSRQTNRYPWTSATKTWKWFYRDALPQEKALEPKWWSYLFFGSEKDRVKSEYSRQLEPFKQSMERLFDDDSNYMQDLEQLYVLHVNEKYKNLHLSDLRKITERGICIGILSVAVLSAVGWICDSQRIAPHPFSLSSGVLKLNGSWRRATCSDEVDCDRILVNVEVFNPSPNAVSLPSYLGVDAAGAVVPLRVEGSSPVLTNAPAESKKTMALVLSPLGVVRSPIKELVVQQ